MNARSELEARDEGWTPLSLETLAGDEGLVIDGDWVESKDQDPSGSVRLVQLADVGDGVFLNKSRRFMTLAKAKELRCTFLKPGDVLIARMPDPLGRACIFPGLEQPAVTVVDVCIWRGSARGADPKWLMYAINSRDIRARIAELASGTTRQRVSGGNLKRLHIPTPPRTEQQTVVRVLDALTARARELRAKLEKVMSLIEQYRSSLLIAAFKGDLTKTWRALHLRVEPAAALVARTKVPPQPRGGREASKRVIPGVAGLSVNDPKTALPLGWTWVPLNRVARQETGHTPSRSHPEWWVGEVPWVGIKDAALHHGRTIQETLQATNNEGLANSAARLLPKDTVCLSRTASIGYVLMLGRPMATSQDFVTWTCSAALDPHYLMYALMAEGDEIRRFGKGSTHTTIYFPEVRAMHIALPPHEEQREIVRLVEHSFGAIARTEKNVAEATALLDRTERAILTKAIRNTAFAAAKGSRSRSVQSHPVSAHR